MQLWNSLCFDENVLCMLQQAIMAKVGCCKHLACHLLMGSIGVILIVAGAVFIGLHLPHQWIDSELDKQLVLSLDSPVYSEWVDPAPPIYMQYWFFNVTNSKDVVNGGKPSVKQIGPFTYRLYQPRIDIAFYGNYTASYKYNHTLVFQRNMSCGDTNIVIKQLNVPLLVIDQLAGSLPALAKPVVEGLVELLKDSSLFVDHTVDELLFGYTDPVLKLVSDLLKPFGVDIPPQFGVFMGFNNSDDGTYLVDSGRSDVSKANTMYKWNGEESLSYWSSAEANMINGTDGVFMNPKVNKSDTLYIFNTDVCRSLYLVYAEDTSVRGIDTYRFHLPSDVFANVSINPNNAGFCVPKDKCYDSGVMTLGPCKQNAPVFVSAPHFYMGAQKFVNGVEGMHPNKAEHETILDIEPMSGAVFQADKRLQINIMVTKSKMFPQMKHVNEVLMPLLWLNESVYLDTASANKFKLEVVTLVRFVHVLPYLLLGIGAFFFLLAFILLVQRWRRTSSAYVKINDDQQTASNSADNDVRRDDSKIG